MNSSDEASLRLRIGRAVKVRRQAVGLTQEEAAVQLDIDAKSLSRIERGATMPGLPLLNRMALVFQCGLSDLVTEGSVSLDDEARQLKAMLARVSAQDREWIFSVVTQFVDRLARP